MSKRIRFGLVFVGPAPAKDGGFLKGLGIKHIEGCCMGNRHYVIFALEKAKKPMDVIRAIEEHNQRCPSDEMDEELLMASDGMLSSISSPIVLVSCGTDDGAAASKGGKHRNAAMLSKVAVFDKGHAYQSHEIFRVIVTAKLSSDQVEAPPIPSETVFVPSNDSSRDAPSCYWSWGSPEEPPISVVHKRSISELSSDLVEECIKPSAPKRVSFASTDQDDIDENSSSIEEEPEAVVVDQQVYFVAVFLLFIGRLCIPYSSAVFVGRMGVRRPLLL
jgi:hypothetical protein